MTEAPNNPREPLRRASKHSRLGVRFVQSGQIKVYWSAVEIPCRARLWLEKAGLAEFRRVFQERVGQKARGRRQLAVWFARLTTEGVRVRDEFDRKQAEKKNARIRRGQRTRHDRHMAKRADGRGREDSSPDGGAAR